MTAAGARPVFHLPARDIPVPSSISPEAQAMLAMGPLMPDTKYPPLDDHDAWRALIVEREAAGHGGFLGQAPEDRERNQEIQRFMEEHWAR
jgi:epsilon-lactone hydrolase